MARRGCLPFEMPGNRQAWYLPISDQGITRVAFTDLAGQQRKKALQGRSEVMKANWHLAVVARPSIRPSLQYALSLHVVFTEDGRAPLGDAKRMHAMRRRFCKNWWQKQWRDLLLAYLAFVAQGQTYIELKVSEKDFVNVPVRPSMFRSRMTFLEGDAEIVEPDEPPEPTDVDDEGDEFEDDAGEDVSDEVRDDATLDPVEPGASQL